MQGPDLPIPMAGQCQLNIGDNGIFIFGGLISFGSNDSHTVHNDYPVLAYSNLAWIWNNGNWSRIPTPAPCPSSRLPPTIMQQCAMKGSSKVVILHQDFRYFTTCTSLLDLITSKWISLSLSNKMPLGGFMLQGIQPHRTYYIGGYTRYDIGGNTSVYELTTKEWKLIKTELQFGLTGWNSMVLDSRLNLTKCMKDSDIWPTY